MRGERVALIVAAGLWVVRYRLSDTGYLTVTDRPLGGLWSQIPIPAATDPRIPSDRENSKVGKDTKWIPLRRPLPAPEARNDQYAGQVLPRSWPCLRQARSRWWVAAEDQATVRRPPRPRRRRWRPRPRTTALTVTRTAATAPPMPGSHRAHPPPSRRTTAAIKTRTTTVVRAMATATCRRTRSPLCMEAARARRTPVEVQAGNFWGTVASVLEKAR